MGVLHSSLHREAIAERGKRASSDETGAQRNQHNHTRGCRPPRFRGNESGCPEPLPRAINVTLSAAIIAESLRAEVDVANIRYHQTQ